MIEMLCGKCIIAASNIYEAIKHVVHKRTPTLHELGVDVDADIQKIIMRLHRKQPDDRFLDEHELLQQLSETRERLAS
jgi:hypothetical protein